MRGRGLVGGAWPWPADRWRSSGPYTSKVLVLASEASVSDLQRFDVPALGWLLFVVGVALLLLLDLFVPGQNAMETIIRLKSLPSAPKVVVLSHRESDEYRPGAFAAALTPIPDDLVYIPLGLAKYNPAKFAIATFIGKFILNEFIVFGSVLFGRPVVQVLTAESTNPIYLYIGIGASISILILIIFLYLRIDWGKIIGKWFPWTLNNNNNEDNTDFVDKK